jgi:hypothetical protein
MLVFRFSVFVAVVMILAGCGSTGPQTPIWVRENSPPPLVDRNVSGSIVQLRSGDSACLHITFHGSGYYLSFYENSALRRALEDRGISIKSDSCILSIVGTIRFVVLLSIAGVLKLFSSFF